jgi:hypothetical protein
MTDSEGVYEVHYQRREYGQLTWQCYRRMENGQFRWVADYESAPFDGDTTALHYLLLKVHLDFTSPAA